MFFKDYIRSKFPFFVKYITTKHFIVQANMNFCRTAEQLDFYVMKYSTINKVFRNVQMTESITAIFSAFVLTHNDLEPLSKHSDTL